MIAVAIDGPSGAGKSTIARRAAQALSFIYVDTGALYRTIGLYMSQHIEDTKDAKAVEALLPKVSVELRFIGGEQRVFLNGEDVSGKIRTPQAAMHASNVSAIPAVRAFLLNMQRELAASSNVIMDGRDIGTVVLPKAQVKIFLTASVEARAKRRLAEHEARGEQIDFDELVREIETRDYNDSHRAAAPLKQAEDAVLVDTTDLSFEESVERIISLIRRAL
ncbi:MAG: (d)CMP kinase [Oscillospiraceae bacterium]|nr:(d)CMP kinase [Oscillospiraceae bacterium]MDY3065272.1 (d)CMP kinase [Oscillospiraceae bacterium]